MRRTTSPERTRTTPSSGASISSFTIMSLAMVVMLSCFPSSSSAWVMMPSQCHKVSPPAAAASSARMRPWTTTSTTTTTTARFMSSSEAPNSDVVTSTTTTTSSSINANKANDEDDEDDWEYVEFESLTEADLVGSEWLVGTCWDSRPDKIDETWCRLVANEKGENIAVWGDNSGGKWALDAASQYITISKTSWLGKQIWACVVEDYYYLRGTVRSWTYYSAAQVEAQWQARRLGVDPEEAGTAPWFEEDDEEEESASAAASLGEADEGDETSE